MDAERGLIQARGGKDLWLAWVDFGGQRVTGTRAACIAWLESQP